MERLATKITVTYDDGSKKDLEKGLVFRFVNETDETDEIEIVAEPVALSGKDLINIVAAVGKMAACLGMFNTEGDDE